MNIFSESSLVVSADACSTSSSRGEHQVLHPIFWYCTRDFGTAQSATVSIRYCTRDFGTAPEILVLHPEILVLHPEILVLHMRYNLTQAFLTTVSQC